MNEPRKWTLAELASDVAQARERFRRQRLDEPLELYTRFFETFAPVFGAIIDRLPSLAGGSLDPEDVAELVDDRDVRTAFRYLAAPPISEDDLKTLAETTLSAALRGGPRRRPRLKTLAETTLSAAALRGDAEQARRVRDTVLHIIDPHRFPWIGEQRDPTVHERTRAIVASAVLVAARKVETSRRSDAKKEQEQAVRTMLRDIGFTEVPSRDIALLDAAPAPGEFCGESKLGDSRADFVIRLHDRRAMPVECKASNSAVNSFKRIDHEAAGKARAWLSRHRGRVAQREHEAAGKARAWLSGFGKRRTVPVAVISGVFSPANLETAQAEGLTIIWSHRLRDLADFIEATRNQAP